MNVSFFPFFVVKIRKRDGMPAPLLKMGTPPRSGCLSSHQNKTQFSFTLFCGSSVPPSVCPSSLHASVMQPRRARIITLKKGHPFKERSVLGGCSGVFYALPLLFDFGSLGTLESAYLIIQAFLSVCSDYIYVFDDSVFHLLDRMVATAGMSYYLYLSASAGTLLSIWLPALLLFLFGSYLRKRKLYKLYNHVHFCWHLWGGLGVAAVHYTGASEPGQAAMASNASAIM